MSEQVPSYIDPSVLADKIKSGTNGDVLIVDVRDPEEYEDGHIVGANLKPSENFNSAEYIDSTITHVLSGGYKTVVFHCAKSQVRGPTCAGQFLNRLQLVPEDSRPKV